MSGPTRQAMRLPAGRQSNIERPLPAKSRLAVVRRLNDWTEATLPDAETVCQRRPGPKLPVEISLANVGA